MSLVLTLIAGPGAEALLPGRAAAIGTTLSNREPDWLAPGRACDLVLRDGDAAKAEALARQAIGNAAIDVLVQPAERRRKRVFVADLESTIIENEMLDELADFVDLRAHVAEITRRAMNGELDFAAALKERVALLKGLPVPMLEAAGLGIAFHAKPAVAAAARWRLDHADLTGILYAQGYRQEEIIEP